MILMYIFIMDRSLICLVMMNCKSFRQIKPLAKEAGFSFEEMEDIDAMIEYFEERLKERISLFVLVHLVRCYANLTRVYRLELLYN